MSLLDALREYLGLTGTKKGCDQSACAVLVHGRRINSCLALAVQYEGREITIVEGLADDGCGHALQDALVEHGHRRRQPPAAHPVRLLPRRRGTLQQASPGLRLRRARVGRS